MSRDFESWRVEVGAMVAKGDLRAVTNGLEFARAFGGAEEPDRRLGAADVLWACMKEVASRGRYEMAETLAVELQRRFASDPSYRIQGRVVAALALLAEVNARRGEHDAACDAFDEGLAIVERSAELSQRGAGVPLLLAKAKLLASRARLDAAIVLLDSSLQMIVAAEAGSVGTRTREAVVAVVAKLDYLCMLGRDGETVELSRQLASVLDRLLHSVSPLSPVQPHRASSSVLAATLAEIVNGGECWEIFLRLRSISTTEAAQRACELYAVANPWVLSGTLQNIAVVSAAAAIRIVADGYALLSRTWTAAERDALPLPQREELDGRLLWHRHAVSTWAATEGYPLRMGDPGSPDGARKDPHVSLAEEAAVSRSTVIDITKCLRLHEIAQVLSSSPSGQQALHHRQIADLTVDYLRFVLDWRRQLSYESASDGRVSVASACLLMAQGVFVSAHCEAESCDRLFPPPLALAEVVGQGGGDAWLRDRGIAPPVCIQSS